MAPQIGGVGAIDVPGVGWRNAPMLIASPIRPLQLSGAKATASGCRDGPTRASPAPMWTSPVPGVADPLPCPAMATSALSDGRSLGFEEWGDPQGSPVVFFHGAPDSRLFHHPDERLARQAGVRLVTVDRPGYGISSPRPGRSLLDWPADVEALVDQLGIDRFAVAGWSAGGPHAMAVAHVLGGRVTKVGLASTFGPLDAPGALADMRRDFRLLWRIRRLTPLIRLSTRAEARTARRDIHAVVDRLVDDAPPRDQKLMADPEVRSMVEVEVAEAFRQGDPGYFGDLLAFLNWGFDPSQVTQPVQLWHGTEDELIAPAMAQRLARGLDECELHIVEGDGHLCVLHHWVELLTSLR